MSSSGSSMYHQIGWKGILEKVFGYKTFYLMAMQGNEVMGIFPLVLVESFLFGRYMVSVPVFDYGSFCFDTDEAREALLEEAIRIATRHGVKHLEIRDNKEYDLGLSVKKSKVALELDLPETSEELWKSFKSKLRSQIRRPQKEGMNVKFGGLDELDVFYRIFSISMRDLGTPVYKKEFFRKILEEFHDTASICMVYFHGEPVGGALLTGFKDTLGVAWASTLRQYNYASPNMLLYWNMLEYACKEGYRKFDFGRSTPGSGTYRFKKQWGADIIQLYWYYWLSNGQELPELNPDNKKYDLAIKTWQKMPVWLTQLIGPHIVRGLP